MRIVHGSHRYAAAFVGPIPAIVVEL